MRLAGFVLAGGESRRMGQDKALLPFHGEPLTVSLARTVSQITDRVSIIGDPANYSHLGFPVVADAVPRCGPAGGIYTALLRNETDWNVVVACDMPRVTAALLRTLVRHAVDAEGDCGDCIVPLGFDGQPEPLCAVYHLRCRPVLERAICENRLRMRDLVAELRPVLVSGADPGCFLNVNTPADWRQVEEFAR